jgi:hypothetical protein
MGREVCEELALDPAWVGDLAPGDKKGLATLSCHR